MSERVSIQIEMKADTVRSNLVRGLVWFVNYAAIDPTAVKASDLDLHGAAMLPDDVEKFAHRWLAFSRSIDIEHDGVGRPVHVVESFFNGPEIAAPAWPINSHAVRMDVSGSIEALEGLRSGRLNSVSLDAYTFNKIVRLPVAEAKAALGQQSDWIIPTSAQKWAEELAREGYPGVTRVERVADDLYVAAREGGMPVAVSVKGGRMEASAAGGPWGMLAMSLFESGTLTSSKRSIHRQPVDYSRWNEDEVIEMLAEVGVHLDKPATDQFADIVDDIFAYREDSTQRSYLPHHVIRGGEVMLSKEGVAQALSRLSEIPEKGREAAREHLMRHMAELSDVTPSQKSSMIMGDMPGGAP